jgi:putative ABC transport system permease protein
MVRHALKLIWNRRRASWLVVVEIAAAFVITFFLTALAIDLVGNYRRPLGFEYENVLSVTVQRGDNVYSMMQAGAESYSETIDGVLAALRALPRTDTAEPMPAPYSGRRMRFGLLLNPAVVATTTEALQAIGVELVTGRWFGPEDEGQTYRAVLINRTFAERAFGSEAEAIGQRIDGPVQDSPFGVVVPPRPPREFRVVGVIEEFRQQGEFSPTAPVAIERHEPGDQSGFQTFDLLLKTLPGTDASFAEQIVKTAQSVAPDWNTSVTSWEQLRASSHRGMLLPLKAGATIAVFFIALVVMGLIGVLWQDVVRRTQEIGLRRALGAGAASVRRQIQLETLIIGAFGLLIGGVIAIQFPLLELIGLIDWASSVPALVLSAAAILILVLLSALYPSWLASRREPADALRYE